MGNTKTKDELSPEEMAAMEEETRAKLDNREFIIYAGRNDLKRVSSMLAHSSVDPTYSNNRALTEAAERGCVDVVKVLLQDPRINANGGVFTAAVRSGHLEVVKVFLKDSRVNPGASTNAALCAAAECGHLEIVKLLLLDERVNPADHHNAALSKAAGAGHLDVMRALLEDERVNPSDSEALAEVAEQGQVEALQLLLDDPRPQGISRAIMGALQRKKEETAQLILKSPRMSPQVFEDISCDPKAHAFLQHLFIASVQKNNERLMNG